MKALLLAAVAIAACSMAAHAGEPVPQKARKLAERGRELHQRGDYSRAIIAFKEAYVLAPSPGLLFNLAQAYRLQGSCEDAALMYRRYIATVPRSAVDERALAEGHLATVTRCMERRTLNLPPDAAMSHIPSPPQSGIDGLFVDAPAPPPARSRGQTLRKVGVGATIAGGAALTVAGYFAIRALNAASDVERLYAEGGRWKDIQPIHERGERAESAAKWLGIGGGITAAAGVTLYLVGRRAERAPVTYTAASPRRAPPSVTRSSITVAPAPGGAQVGMSWTF
jgi:tetratricopeptide (TPR) repeat protein